MDGYRMTRMVLITSRWMAGTGKTEVDGVNMAFGSRWITEGKIGRSKEPWRIICRWLSFTRPLLPGSCVLSNLPPAVWWLITRRGLGCRHIMRLGQTVNKAQLLISRCRCLCVWDKGRMLHDYAWVIWLELSTSPCWRERCILSLLLLLFYYYYYDCIFSVLIHQRFMW